MSITRAESNRKKLNQSPEFAGTAENFPFAAVVGLSLPRQALLLLAIEPQLGGVIISARPGMAKTTLARSLHTLLPTIEAIAGCTSHCNPVTPASWCSSCRAAYRTPDSHAPETVVTIPPFINLPLNVTEDRLLGGLNLEATLQQGSRVAERGLMAQANRGVLYCDELNLLEDNIGNYLMDALSRGHTTLEREGLSAEYPASFMLIGTYNPDEGEVRGGLADRVGMLVSANTISDPDAHVEIISRVLDFSRYPTEFLEQYAPDTAELAEAVRHARWILPQVTITDDQQMALCEVALRLGVPGNRADIFAVRAARANAALHGRDAVDEDDLKAAVQLVLYPRATQMPEPPPDEEEPPPPPENEQEPEQPPDDSEDDQPDDNEEQQDTPQTPQLEDLVLAALAAPIPEDVLSLVQTRQARAKSGSRGETYNWKRGRHVQSLAGKPGQARIDILTTLRTAAPFQNMRKAEKALTQPAKPGKVEVRSDDIRLKRYKDKAGVLFIFMVDASGSMALNRMREAKGAVTQLLQQAYVHRDKVALIAFRGKAAEVLLPPSQSVELAKRSLDVLPTGGGTPLASALVEGFKMSEQARRTGISKTMLVLLTDGRGNILLNEDDTTNLLSKDARREQAATELATLSATIVGSGIAAVVLDTQTNFVSRGEAALLARQLGAHYIYLPRADARQIAANVSASAENLRQP